MSRRGLLVTGMALLLTSAALGQSYANPKAVIGSSHDFSSSSPAPYKSSSQTEVCIFCHTPHNANPKAPLWNHANSGASYTLYTSSTLKATMGQPLTTDSDKLCLGCHDGTVALGNTVNDGSIPFQNSVTTLPNNIRAYIGTNLGDDHPTAFVPVLPTLPAFPQVQAPPTGDPVTLPAGRVQCTSCHEAHEESRDATEKRFLIKGNSASAICLSCHVLQNASGAPNPWSWNGSKGQVTNHATAANTYNTVTNDGGVTWLGSHTGYTTTATNGCEACHRPHTAHNVSQLEKGATDQVCFQCHDGNATTNIPWNISTAFSSKLYQHPGTGTTQSGHDPNETPVISSSRHGACDDCHNPHAASSYTTTPNRPFVQPNMIGVSGVNSSGVAIDPRRGSGEVTNQYEICFKCHADSTNKPQSVNYSTYGRTAYRQNFSGLSDPYNERLNFGSSVSRHNVTQPRKATAVPSLRSNMLDLNGSITNMPSLASGTYLYCTDCHTNDQDRTVNGTGPKGVHGSANTHLFERKYTLESANGGGVNYSPGINGTYALCYKCHNIGGGAGGGTDLMNNQSSGFKDQHPNHIQDQQSACSDCHASHGIQGGSATSNKSLVNFDTAIVSPVNGKLSFTATSTGGTCYLTCHGEDHNPKSY